jgi:hypothetical protein
MAIEASIQLKCNTGLDMVGVLSSKGSIIRTKPKEKKLFIFSFITKGNDYTSIVYYIKVIFTGIIIEGNRK